MALDGPYGHLEKREEPNYLGSSIVVAADLVLERQTPEDLEAAWAILASRTDELIQKKTGQYVAPYPPLDLYANRTQLGQNWLVRRTNDSNRKIMGIVSIIPNGGTDDCAKVPFPTKYFWISSLFVGPSWKNRGLGRAILDRVKLEARQNSVASIWLDCYLDSGFLEEYYVRNGLQTIETQRFTYGSRSFNAALMSCLLE